MLPHLHIGGLKGAAITFAKPRIDVLTRVPPSLDAARLLKAFAKGVRPLLDSLHIPPQLRFKQDANELFLTLGPHRISVRTLGRSYWGEEGGDQAPEENDIWEYGPRAAWMEHDGIPGADGLEDAILESKGAVIIESVETPDPQTVVPVMAHLAAAAMTDAIAMIVPTSGAIHPADNALRDKLRQCQGILTALQYVVRTEVMPIEGDSPLVRIAVTSKEFWYIVYGLHPFGLPDVGLRFSTEEDDQGPMQEAAVDVQSFVAYLLNRRAPVPAGDTVTVGVGRTYRVVDGQFPAYPHGTCGRVELGPI